MKKTEYQGSVLGEEMQDEEEYFANDPRDEGFEPAPAPKEDALAEKTKPVRSIKEATRDKIGMMAYDKVAEIVEKSLGNVTVRTYQDDREYVMEKEAQRKKFMEAMASVSAEIPKIPKNKEVLENGKPIYRYADLPAITDTMRPILAKHGLFVEFRTIPNFATGLVTTVMIVHHKDGYSYRSEIFYAMARNINDIQSLGSAITYSKRYMFCSMFNICAEPDDDGNKASGRDANQAADLETRKPARTAKPAKEPAKPVQEAAAAPKMPEPPEQKEEKEQPVCEDCGKKISQREFEYSAKNFGRIYCMNCQQNHK